MSRSTFNISTQGWHFEHDTLASLVSSGVGLEGGEKWMEDMQWKIKIDE